MIERRIVRRYASALFGAASAAGVVDQVESDLGFVTYVMETSPDMMDAITSPRVPRETKRNLLRAIFGDKVQELTLNYLFLLVDKRREEAILQTEEEFILLANEARGIVEAHVTTAVELREAEESALIAKLSTMTGKSIQLVKAVDPRIMGGILIRIGDTVIDASIKGQLEALREELLS